MSSQPRPHPKRAAQTAVAAALVNIDVCLRPYQWVTSLARLFRLGERLTQKASVAYLGARQSPTAVARLVVPVVVDAVEGMPLTSAPDKRTPTSFICTSCGNHKASNLHREQCMGVPAA